jgi:signal transduction histidine kinase
MTAEIPKELNEAYEKVISYLFHLVPISEMNIEAVIAEESIIYGTTIDESIFGIDDFKRVMKMQEKEMEGLELRFERTPVSRFYSKDGETGVFVETVKLIVNTGEAVSEDDVRMSFVMQKTDRSWKLIHAHGSKAVDSEEDPWHVKEWRVEKEKLEKRVSEQTAALQQKNLELEMESATERVRAEAMGMQKPDDIMNVLNVIKAELNQSDLGNIGTWFWIFNDDNTLTQWDISETGLDGSLNNINITVDLETSIAGSFHEPKWHEEEYYNMPWNGEPLQQLIDEITELDPEGGQVFQKLVDNGEITTYWQACAPFSRGVLGLDFALEPPKKVKPILTKVADAFGIAYQRYEDLRKAEQQAYESKVEASLERVRGMASAMNHSDDLMQIAEAMFKEMEILKINPLRYGLGMIDPGTKEAELWASTVDDGRYLDMLGTISLTWHPMLKKVLDAWDAQHEELIYELKGKERSDYYRKIGRVNPDIPNLEALQDPSTDISEFVSFFPFKSGALYAFTKSEPGEEGRTILKRFSSVFEQAHIRYNDLQIAEQQAQQIKEERDRLADTLKELRATQEQLVQREKLASLGQLTAGIAHEIKNPLNFVNNFSDLSVELIQEAREEVLSEKAKVKRQNSPFEGGKDGEAGQGHDTKPGDASNLSIILEILDDIETNLKTIHRHGSRADSIVKSMLQHSRGGNGTMEPTLLNPLIKEYVNLAFHGMRAAKDPINVDIDLQLDKNIGEVPLIAEDFSRVILNLVNNAFDAMREKVRSKDLQGFENLGDLEDYHPKLTVQTLQKDQAVTIEVEDNGPGISEEIKDKILQPFFTTKKGTAGTGLGLSITNDIVKAHGGTMNIKTKEGLGSTFTIELPK